MAPDDAVLPVDRHAGEIAYVLVRTGELVEQGRLAAILVACERERERRIVGKRVLVGANVKPPALAETGVFRVFVG